MSNQIVISSGAKVRELEGVLTGTAGIVNALGINVPSGIPQLDGSGKILVSQLPNSVMEYKGSWNAATNTPTLVNGTGNAGDVYLCEVAGTVNFGAGPITFAVGDQVIYSGSIWQRASGATGTVTSVAVTESGDALTITGSPITTSGTINIGFAGTSGQYVNGAGGLTTFPSLTGFVPYTGATGSVNLGAYSLTATGVTANSFYAQGNGTQGGYLYLKQGTTPYSTLTGASSISADGTKYIFFSDAGSSNGKIALFELGSLSNNTNRTYTLPDLSGTLALLEGSQTFSGSKIFSNSAKFTSLVFVDRQINLSKTPSLVSYTGGYITNYGTTSGIIYADGDTSNLSTLNFNFGGNYTYTFPAASGTIALTSNLSSYVPYTGATGAVNLGAFDLTVNSLTIGRGGSAVAANVAIGISALFSNTTGNYSVAIGLAALSSNTSGGYNTAIGASSLTVNITGYNNTAIGYASLNYNTGSYNTAIGSNSLGNNTTGYQNTAVGPQAGLSITTGANNTIIGAYAGTAAMSNNIVLADGAGNIRYQFDGTNNIFTSNLNGTSASFASSGGSDTFAINHSSGSGIALNITKGGNGEGLYINKTSGSGNALTVIGSTSLGALSGTSATFSGLLTINVPTDNTTVGIFHAGGGTANRGLKISTFAATNDNAGVTLDAQTSTGVLAFATAGAEKMRITSGGNVGIGTTGSAWDTVTNLQVLNASLGGFFGNTYLGANTYYGSGGWKYITTDFSSRLELAGGGFEFYTAPSGTAASAISYSLPMTILSGGNVLINRSSLSGDAGGALFQLSQSNANWIHYVENTASSGAVYGSYINFKNQAPNNTASFFTYFGDSSTGRFYVYANGGIANYQANNSNLSDERTKKDIIPLESYWDKFKAIEIVKFKYKDQTHDDFNIGVIAQQIEKVAPEFVDIDGWDKPKLDEEGNQIISNEEPLKSVYTSDLHHATIKVLQECMAKIEEQQAQIEELKALISAKN